MTNQELIKALKYISRKKTAIRRKIAKHINPKEDVTNNLLFHSYVEFVSKPRYVNARFTSQPEDRFKLNTEGHNLLAEYDKESKAVMRANLSLLLSLAAVLIAAAAFIYSVFVP